MEKAYLFLSLSFFIYINISGQDNVRVGASVPGLFAVQCLTPAYKGPLAAPTSICHSIFYDDVTQVCIGKLREIEDGGIDALGIN